MRTLVWFRKTLRVHDNPALLACIENASSVTPVFILDRWHKNSNNIGNIRFEFLMQSLRCLDETLVSKGVKSGLIFIEGEPEKVLPKVWKELSIDAMGFDDSEEQEVHSKQVDEKVKELAEAAGVSLLLRESHTMIPITKYRNALDGKPVPTSMKEFQKLFSKAGPVPEPLAAPSAIPFDENYWNKQSSNLFQTLKVKSFDVPDSEDFYRRLNREKPKSIKYPGGEEEGLKRLESTVVKRPAWVSNFSKPKTAPNSIQPDTAVLSPYLTHGCLSIRKVYAEVLAIEEKSNGKHTKPPESFLGQILWREHWYTIGSLSGQDISKMEGNSICRNIPWDRNDDSRKRLEKWATAQTGYPFIDAIMTQLRTEGWIHHLARHMVACFLTRGDLWVSWEEGAKVFDRYLIDADWTLNNCNWMWLSCSAFFYQYFRCYSPIAFGKKTDPQGDYIRKYVPALAKFPDKYIYEPWKAPKDVQQSAGCIIGKDYPTRMVLDHTKTSKENMAKMQQAYKAYQQAPVEKGEADSQVSQKKRDRVSAKAGESKRSKITGHFKSK